MARTYSDDSSSLIILPLNAQVLEQLSWLVGDTVEVEVNEASVSISRAAEQTQKFGIAVEQTFEDFEPDEGAERGA